MKGNRNVLNNIEKILRDDLLIEIKDGSKVSIAARAFIFMSFKN